MGLSKRHIYFIVTVVLLTTFLTWFFYAHETLPKPIRAATALIETPVAIASGLSHYLKLGVDVYETPWAIILTNFLFSVVMVFLVDKFFKRRKQKYALK
ncbi:MAG: hypothetical protein ACKVQB_10385 [Bacteroidia bacterium]